MLFQGGNQYGKATKKEEGKANSKKLNGVLLDVI